MFLVLASCASKKQVTNETKSTYFNIDSVKQATKASDEITIVWSFDSLTRGIEKDSSPIPAWAKPYLSTMDKPPMSGTITIKRSKCSEIVSLNTKSEEESKIAKKNKTKEPNQMLKLEKPKNRLNAIYVIIFAILVKYIFDHRNFLKNIWSKLQNYLSLHRH